MFCCQPTLANGTIELTLTWSLTLALMCKLGNFNHNLQFIHIHSDATSLLTLVSWAKCFLRWNKQGQLTGTYVIMLMPSTSQHPFHQRWCSVWRSGYSLFVCRYFLGYRFSNITTDIFVYQALAVEQQCWRWAEWPDSKLVRWFITEDLLGYMWSCSQFTKGRGHYVAKLWWASHLMMMLLKRKLV